MKFKYYVDPGHGWVAVKRKLIQELGIESNISSYSYQRGATVYLEEDCDASAFVNAYEQKHGTKPAFDFRHTNNSSPIRSYDTFQA